MSQRLHIVTHEKGWAIRREGDNQVLETYSTQRLAIDAANDIAEREQVDIVVHRQDGTFRKVISPESNGSSSTSGTSRKGSLVQPADLISVGSRISWPAIFAGAVIAIAFYITIGTLAKAIELSIAGGSTTGTTLALFNVIWFLVLCLGSMFLGGYVVSRTTAGETSTEAITYGVVLWGTVVVGMGILMSVGVGAISTAELAGANPQQMLAVSEEQLTQAGFTPAEVSDLKEKGQKYQQVAESQGPVRGIWWIFLGMTLSLAAAVAGAVAGAGPHIKIRRDQTGNPVAVTKS